MLSILSNLIFRSDDSKKTSKDKKISAKMSSSFAGPSKKSPVTNPPMKQKSLGIDDLRREMKKK